MEVSKITFLRLQYRIMFTNPYKIQKFSFANRLDINFSMNFIVGHIKIKSIKDNELNIY